MKILFLSFFILIFASIASANDDLPSLGVCYYPEHWKISGIAEDIHEMKKLGLKYVRIGEFMWSVIEPKEGEFNWKIIDETLRHCASNNLHVVLGTPTATPPKWLVDKYGGNGDKSTILPFDDKKHARRFGSRRHYSFSSIDYRKESSRIVSEMAKRYGTHPAVKGWQTDNEYGCHDTVLSYDKNAKKQFRSWLKRKYNNNILSLNRNWGTIFWSAKYNSFDEIDLPSSTVTEAFPNHRLDFQKFSSDQVISFNKEQVEIIRRYSPNRFITHNFMGFFFQFDHFKIMKELDFASWDSYPLGFTDTTLGLGKMFDDQEKIEYTRTGHPDIAAFHHDLYSCLSGLKKPNDNHRGTFWVMEQQPGSVNWADNNPMPENGMVRLWSWEAFAHHANVVSYFRWRQVPFAQEQMHSGLHLPNNEKDAAYYESKIVLQEIEKLKKQFENNQETKSTIGLIFDYETEWMMKIQPQGKDFHYLRMFYTFYSQLRQFGLTVDILKPGTELSQYNVVMIPSLTSISDEMLVSLKTYLGSNPNGLLVFGPRSGSKTEHFSIPSNLAPGRIQEIIPLQVQKVESFREGAPAIGSVKFDGNYFKYTIWREMIKFDESNSNFKVIGRFNDELPAILNYRNKIEYIGFWPSKQFIRHYLMKLLIDRKIPHTVLDKNIRITTRKRMKFVFNYNSDTIVTPQVFKKVKYLLGGNVTLPHSLSVYVEDE
eukprot:gene9140-1228_t